MNESTLPSRASILSPETLAQMNATPLPADFSTCERCACILVTMGDRARHLNIDGDCPRDLLSEYGKRPGDTYTEFARSGHLMVLHIHGLNEDGTPRVWGNGATHSEDCLCIQDPEQWAVEHPERYLSVVEEAS